MTSDFRPEVEIRLFRACTMKNTQYNTHLWPNRQNFSFLKKSGSGNTMVTSDFRPEVEIAVSCMRHASGHRNSSFIVDVAMGQIPRSTERISYK